MTTLYFKNKRQIGYQQIVMWTPVEEVYIKQNGAWVQISKVYVKENGEWVEKE